MALKDELQPASYKGVPFLVNITSVTGGRKDVLHEFPNSNIQNIEDLGLRPRVYNITAIIAQPNYIQKRDALLAALEEGGDGVLVHPFYGRLEKIRARSFVFDEVVTRLGDTDIRIVFGPSDTDGLPTQTINTVSLVANRRDTVNTSIISDITNLFTVTNSFSGNFTSAVTKLTAIAIAITANSKSLTATPDQINDFSSLVSTFSASINQLITNPADLGSSLNNIFIELPKLYATAGEQTAAMSLFFDFGDDDIAISETTAGLTERKQNNDVLNNSVKGFALTGAYVSTSQTDFTTVDEIETTSSSLETAFQSIKSASGLS